MYGADDFEPMFAFVFVCVFCVCVVCVCVGARRAVLSRARKESCVPATQCDEAYIGQLVSYMCTYHQFRGCFLLKKWALRYLASKEKQVDLTDNPTCAHSFCR